MTFQIIHDDSAELSRKADLALSDLASGGLLSAEQSNTFFRNLIDQPTILQDARTIQMSRPSLEINKIGFGSRILKPASQTAGSRSLSLSDRSKPDTGKLELNTKEVIAEVRLPYETLEDNIERGSMENTLIQLIAERAALDLEELIVQGDTASDDTYLGLMEGMLELTTTNTVDAANAGIAPSVFSNAIKALPTRYRRNKRAMRFYTSHDVEQDYRLAVSSRQGGNLGDATLAGDAPLSVFGVPLRGIAMMPDTNMIFVNPANVIFGIQRNVRIETDRDISSREVIIVLTSRVATQFEEENAVVKVTNIG